MKTKLKVRGKRTLNLVSPGPCNWCQVSPGPQDPLWGVWETVTYETEYRGCPSRFETTKKPLAEKVTLFEAQAVYSGAMQWPPPEEKEFEIDYEEPTFTASTLS